VFGVGGTLTLASWTDTELAGTEFTSSTFGILGSADGTTFSEHTESAAELAFTLSPNLMSPGKTAVAPFVVKTTPDTNVEGTVQLGGATVSGTGLDAELTYGVKTVVSVANCTAEVMNQPGGSVVLPNGTTLTAGATGAQPLAAGGGSPIVYCFGVTMNPDAPPSAQGKTATATWTFTATSSS